MDGSFVLCGRHTPFTPAQTRFVSGERREIIKFSYHLGKIEWEKPSPVVVAGRCCTYKVLAALSLSLSHYSFSLAILVFLSFSSFHNFYNVVFLPFSATLPCIFIPSRYVATAPATLCQNTQADIQFLRASISCYQNRPPRKGPCICYFDTIAIMPS